MTYRWIHPPLKYVKEYEEGIPQELQIVDDDIGQNSLCIKAFDVPKKDRQMFSLHGEPESYFEEEKRKSDEGEETEDLMTHYGFWVSGDTSTYSQEPRDPLKEPGANDVFVSMYDDFNGSGVYLPVGQHSSGSHHYGDYLISIEDYEAISEGIYTPATYTCDVVREWDLSKMLRPKEASNG